jgi:hypothetical protein
MKRTYSDQQFISAVASSTTWAGVLRCLKLKQGGGVYVAMKILAKNLGLDTSHMIGQGWSKGRELGEKCGKRTPLSEI